LGPRLGVGHGGLAGLAFQLAGVGDRELHAAYVVSTGGHRRGDDGANAVHVTHGDVVVVPHLVAATDRVAGAIALILAPERQSSRADVRLVHAGSDERLADGDHQL